MLRFARAPAIMPSRKDPEQGRAEQPRFSHNELSQFLFYSLIPSFPNRVLD